MRKGKGKK